MKGKKPYSFWMLSPLVEAIYWPVHTHSAPRLRASERSLLPLVALVYLLCQLSSILYFKIDSTGGIMVSFVQRRNGIAMIWWKTLETSETKSMRIRVRCCGYEFCQSWPIVNNTGRMKARWDEVDYLVYFFCI